MSFFRRLRKGSGRKKPTERVERPSPTPPMPPTAPATSPESLEPAVEVPYQFTSQDKLFIGNAEVLLSSGRVELPMQMASAARVTHILQDPQYTVSQIEKAINFDQVLATEVLKVANSAAFGGWQEITNLRQAIVRLGYRKMRSLMLSLSLRATLVKHGSHKKTASQLWQHSLGCAVVGRAIAPIVSLQDEELFVGGLLHDIGKVGLLVSIHDLTRLMEGYRPPTPVVIEVLDRFHTDFGSRIADKWGLPSSTAEVISWHHDFAKSERSPRLVAAVSLANSLCHLHGAGCPPEEIDIHSLPSTAFLQLAEAQVARALAAAPKALAELEEGSF